MIQARSAKLSAPLRSKFEAIAREYLELKSKSLSVRTYDKKLGRFEEFAFPFIGKLPITSIAAPQLLMALGRIEERGTHETAHRVRGGCGEVFRHAVATGRAERDPTGTCAPRYRRSPFATTRPSSNPSRLDSYCGPLGH